MESPELKKKFNELQKYIPFLERVIHKLKHTKRDEHDTETTNSTHLDKVKMLYDLLTNDSKKLTLDALNKCEKVLSKLYCKIEQTSSLQDGVSETIVLDELEKEKPTNVTSGFCKKSEDTILSVPESPPPDDGSDDCVFVPLVIPTERCITPNKSRSHRKHHTNSHRREKSHRERSENTEDRKFKYDPQSYYENRDHFERQRYDRPRYDKDRDRYSRGSQNYGPDKMHRPRQHSYDRTHDRDNIQERPKVIDDHSKDVFSRLGDKLPDDKCHIEGIKRTITQNVSGNSPTIVTRPISKVPDDSKFVKNECIDTSLLFKSNTKIDMAYGIGERREPKQESKGLSKLDEVRKKLSLLAKSSTDASCKDSPNSQKGQEQSYKSETPIVQDPRLKKSNYASNTQSVTLTLLNMAPSLNRMDPRLRKNSNSSSCSSNSHSLSNEPSKCFNLDQGRNSSFVNRSNHNNVNNHSSMDFLQKSSNSNQRKTFNSEENWDADKITSQNHLHSSKVKPNPWQSDVFFPNIQPSSLNHSENWGNELNYKEKNYGSVNNSSCSYNKSSKSEKETIIGSVRSPLNFQANSSQNNLKSFPQHNHLEIDRPEPKKGSYISPSSKIENNNHSTNLFKSNCNSSESVTNSNQSLFNKPKENEVLDENADNSEENWDDDNNYGNRLSSYEANRRRVLAAEKLEEESQFEMKGIKTSNNAHVNKTSIDINNVEDDIPTSSKFNALLNDKSERIHYLESKKQKEQNEQNDLKCSRTYAEYKRKKALLEENRKKELAESRTKQSDDQKHGNNEKKSSSMNESVDSVKKDHKHNNYNDKKSNSIQESIDSMKKDHKHGKNDKKSNSTPESVETVKKDHKQANHNDKKSNSIHESVETVKKDHKHNHKKSNPFSKNKEPSEQAEHQRTKTESAKKENVKNKSNETEIALQTSDKVTPIKSNKVINNKTNIDTVSETNNLHSDGSKPIKPCEKEPSINNQKKSNKNKGNISSISDIKPSEKTQRNTAKLPEKDDEKLQPITKEEVSKLKNFRESPIQRKRRNSMCEFESKSLVEKDKLQFANTILYADLQCEARPNYAQKKTNENRNRNTESLANIFKKTDDNCTVSTQNIISGKRRTRTTVNFNEVEQAKTVFKHIRKSTGSNIKKLQQSERNETSETLQQIDDTTCSSVKSSETSQESGNQEALEGFVQDMLKPDADMEYIFGLLGKILPEEKLKLVKTIIESSQTTENVENSEIVSKIDGNQVSLENENDQESTKKRVKKRNELDRLNDDIRDMFISEGVLTATGKRMCKLVNEKSSQEPNKTETIAEKYRKILKRQCKINLPKIKMPLGNVPKVQKETSLNSRDEPKAVKELSTKKKEILESDEDQSLSELKERIKTDSVNLKSEPAVEMKKKAKPKVSRKTILKNDGIRNTNKEHHFLSKYASEMCIVCKVKTSHLSTHYQTSHAESYRSRLAPTIVKKIREGVLGVVTFVKKINKRHIIFHRCPICMQYGNRIYPDWLEHFRTHTAEYIYTCSYCRRGVNKKKALVDHIETQCPKGQVVFNKLPNTLKNCVKAYVCHLCNFVQLHPNHLIRHYVEQHELEKKVLNISDDEVNLMDWTSSEVVVEKRAKMLERKARQNNFYSIFDDLELAKTEETSLDEKKVKVAKENEISVKAELAPPLQTSDPLENILDDPLNKEESSITFEHVDIKRITKDMDQSLTEEEIPITIEPADIKAITKDMGQSLTEEDIKAITKKESPIKGKPVDKKEVTKEDEKIEKLILKHPKIDPQTSNIFLPTPRDTESPTTAFTEKLKTIEQESNEESESVKNSEQHVSMAEKLSQRLKRFNSETDENKAPFKNENVANIESVSLTDSKSCSDDEDSWVDIDSIDLTRKNKDPEKSIDKSKMKTNKRLHRFYASNANRARKIKGSYLNNKRPQLCNLNKLKTSVKLDKATIDKELKSAEVDSKAESSVQHTNTTSESEASPETDQVENTDTLSYDISQFNKIPNVNSIWNIGYSNDSKDVYKFYCLSKECTFLYSNEAIGLENHYLLDHTHLRWNGGCTLCDKRVEFGNDLSVSREIKHMLDVHLKPERVDTPENNDAEEEVPRPPRIKIRRLSGDCLSMSPRPPPVEQNTTLTEVQSQFPTANIQSFDSLLPVISTPQIMNTPLSTPMGLQITNVCSLNQSTLPSACFPKIANVCSLNPASVNVESLCGTLSREQSQSPEPIVVAESVPVARSKTGNFVITQTLSTHYGTNGEQLLEPNMGLHIAVSNSNTSPLADAPEPQIPVPSNQNTAIVGSTQLENKTNQPPYRCMAKNCKYTTRVSVSMLDHLHFHETRCSDTQRDFLRCNHCVYVAVDKLGLLQHIESEHLSKQKNTHILNISIATVASKENKKKKERKPPMTNERYNEIKEAVIGLAAYTAHNADYVYRCIVPNCNAQLKVDTFCEHIKLHERTLFPNAVLEYRCFCCSRCFNNCTDLHKHKQMFGIHHFFCFICAYTTASRTEMQQHFCERHMFVDEIHTELLLAVGQLATNQAVQHSYFVANGNSLQITDVERFRQRLVNDWRAKKLNFSNNIYHYTEVSRLPTQPIFQKEIRCADCAYKTKVRSNMLRHFSLHQSGSLSKAESNGRLDPVNPMPCLNSTEKHFDKMTNLASSSLVPSGTAGTTGMDTPGNLNVNTLALKVPYNFVPINRVYTCGISDCQYLTLREDIFRSHVITLHGKSLTYSCPFCREELCKRGIVMDRIVNHIRFHGQFLYQCESCSYLHYVKSVVRRHIHEKHTNIGFVNLVAYDRGPETGVVTTVTQVATASKEVTIKKTVGSAAPTLTVPMYVNMKVQKKVGAYCWKCDLCGIYTKTHNQMISHCNTVHGCRHRFKCSLCGFGATKETQVLNHISFSHESNIECIAQVMFHKEEDLELISGEQNIAPKPVAQATLNTKPLWQRDDPKRVRHIRGILMEDEEETEQHRKRLRLDDYTENDDDDEIVLNY